MLTDAEQKEYKKGTGLRADILELYHRCLWVILSELIAIQGKDKMDGEGCKVSVFGKGEVYLHFEMDIVIGDTVGHYHICGHYKCYSNRIARPIRSCFVSYDDLDNRLASCEIATMSGIYDVVEMCMSKIVRGRKKVKYREVAKNLSQSLVKPVFCDVSFGGDPPGIFGATSFEVLHLLLLGLIKYTLKALYNYEDPKKKSTRIMS